ncbi:MAG: ZIP family metal transporter [Bacteroidota bacterium]
MMPTYVFLTLFFSIFLSGGLLFTYGRISGKNLKLLLAFSGAYLFSLSVLHLLPEVYDSGGYHIGIFILAGFFLQIILEIFSEGIEHGHMHVHREHGKAFPFALMAGLCIHSLLEGVPLAQRFADESTRTSLLAGIILHHIPVAIALMTMLLDSGIGKRSSLLYLAVFAAMAPLGAFGGAIMSQHASHDLTLLFDRFMALVIGIFLHISTTILFESYEEHRYNIYKLLTIVAGAALALLS